MLFIANFQVFFFMFVFKLLALNPEIRSFIHNLIYIFRLYILYKSLL